MPKLKDDGKIADFSGEIRKMKVVPTFWENVKEGLKIMFGLFFILIMIASCDN